MTNFFNQYQNLDLTHIEDEYRTKNDSDWEKISSDFALNLFHEMATRVPAYKDFLNKADIDPSTIKTILDLSKVPYIDKHNYIDQYPLSSLVWDGNLDTSYFLSSSSGSTGKPYFWPRTEEQTYQGALINESIYRNYFNMDRESTLYIVAFAMGTWIAGTYMTMATEWIAQKKYPITIVTPGTNKDEILKLIKMGTINFKKILLIGYPPFIKDIIDSGSELGYEWNKINIQFMFSGESITERWREHILTKIGKENSLTSALNIYGSADIGQIANESAVTTYIRKAAASNERVRKNLFNSERVPSLNQFIPNLRHFDVENNELLVSSRSGIPLLRYNTKDIGGILYYDTAKNDLAKSGFDIENEFKIQNITNLLWKLPMVYVFGRGKFTAIIYGSNIYPEHVKLVVEHSDIEPFLTGKFIITTEESESHDQKLDLKVELRPNCKPTNELSSKIIEIFINEVSKINSEYRNNIAILGNKVHPNISLIEYGNPDYFPRGIVKKLA